MWQRVDAGNPVANARRLIIASTTRHLEDPKAPLLQLCGRTPVDVTKVAGGESELLTQVGQHEARVVGGKHNRYSAHRRAAIADSTSVDTASAISPIEKKTKSVDGIGSTRAVAPQLPPADSRCRSIQALASPNRLAGAWS